MKGRQVEIVAFGRLHFGMLSAGEGAQRFGGLGTMVAPPCLHVRIGWAERLECVGLLARRVRQIVRQGFLVDARPGGDAGAACRIEVLDAPPLHVGLGTGTQLAMAVAAGLHAWAGGTPLDAFQLAQRTGRGLRSAVGVYGFVHGGLLFDAGKTEGEESSASVTRVELPVPWRFVVICPQGVRGLSGAAEQRAFAHLPPVPLERTRKLYHLARHTLLPAAAAGAFDEFSEALYQFNSLSGLNFAAVQGGPFARGRPAALVRWVRSQGIKGVGQSSWGPVLFALLPDEAAAADLRAAIRRLPDSAALDLWIAAPANCGARIEVRQDLPEKGSGG